MTAYLRPTSTGTPAPERQAPSDDGASPGRRADAPPEIAFEDLLELLGDEYACEILRVLEDGPTPARVLIEERGLSRATVYRRLDRLTEAGIVESHLTPHPDGHHRREFSLVVDEVEFQVGRDGIDGRVAGD